MAEQKEPDFINRMDLELHELDEKLVKAQKFTNTDKFKALTGLEKQLLYIQISTMSTYGATLSTRIDLAKGYRDE